MYLRAVIAARNVHRRLRVASLSLGVLLAVVWGLRWEHAAHAHDNDHSHCEHHCSDDQPAPQEENEECAICDWALAWFEVAEGVQFTPSILLPSSPKSTTAVPAIPATFLIGFGNRGPPVA